MSLSEVTIYKKKINLIETFNELLTRQPSEELASKLGTTLLVHSYAAGLAEIAAMSYDDPLFALELMRHQKSFPLPCESFIWLQEAVHEQIIHNIIMSRPNFFARLLSRILLRMPWNHRIVFTPIAQRPTGLGA